MKGMGDTFDVSWSHDGKMLCGCFSSGSLQVVPNPNLNPNPNPDPNPNPNPNPNAGLRDGTAVAPTRRVAGPSRG